MTARSRLFECSSRPHFVGHSSGGCGYYGYSNHEAEIRCWRPRTSTTRYAKRAASLAEDGKCLIRTPRRRSFRSISKKRSSRSPGSMPRIMRTQFFSSSQRRAARTRTGIGATGTIGITGGIIGTEITLAKPPPSQGPNGQLRIRALQTRLARRAARGQHCVRRKDKRMKNPWLKKNPLMSMWLSSTNAGAGRARRIASAEISKQQSDLSKHIVRFWTGAWQSAVKPKRRR